MDAFNVEEYFIQIGPEFDEKYIQGGPVVTPNNLEIGKISAYNGETGFAKVRLFKTVNYRTLVYSGVPLEHIVFKGQA